jgi:hypothetical protein
VSQTTGHVGWRLRRNHRAAPSSGKQGTRSTEEFGEEAPRTGGFVRSEIPITNQEYGSELSPLLRWLLGRMTWQRWPELCRLRMADQHPFFLLKCQTAETGCR